MMLTTWTSGAIIERDLGIHGADFNLADRPAEDITGTEFH